MKILLADNERMVRLGMISMLNEIGYTPQYIEAVNGIEMIEKAKKYHPDVAFIDIRMPLMDGLSALPSAIEVSPNTQWVILSGYAEFDYAQSALRYGVKEYLLKPVDMEHLKQLMAKLNHEREEIRQQKNKIFEAEVMEAFYTKSIESVPEQFHYYGFLIYFLDWVETDCQNELVRAIKDKVKFWERTQKNSMVSTFYLPSGCYGVMLASDEKIQLSGKWNVLLDKAVTVVYNSENSFAEVLQKADRMLLLGELRILWKYGQFIDLKQTHGNICSKIELLPLAQFLENFCIAYSQKNFEDCKTILLQIKEEKNLPKLYRGIDKNSLRNYFQLFNIHQVSCETFSQLLSGLENILRKVTISEMLSGNSRVTTIINDIKQYMELHYMEGIGLDSISEQFDFSPYYLSRIFHQQVGVSFIDYLTDIRISNAKRLLIKNKNLSIKEIASRVGYSSPQHFHKLFLKRVGKTPLEYRKI